MGLSQVNSINLSNWRYHMNKIVPELFIKNMERYVKGEYTIIASAGYEDRTMGLLSKIKDKGIKINRSIIIDYPNKSLNEPNRTNLIDLAKTISRQVKVIEEDKFIRQIPELSVGQYFSNLILDITGMSRLQFYNIMYCFDQNNILFDLAYTEADSYYPDKNFFQKLKNESRDVKDLFFDAYQKEEEAEIVYSFDCDIIQPHIFRGRPEPGKAASFIGFLTLKRGRLQAILRNYEFSKRVFIVSEPVRKELKWRKEMMKLVNRDLLKKRDSQIYSLRTLYPSETYDLLEEVIYNSRDYFRYNIYIAPLGSKMQTLGTYLFWKKHPEISLIFSQPKKYFPKAYSKSWRKTFIIKKESFL